jgi:hypothetical protein
LKNRKKRFFYFITFTIPTRYSAIYTSRRMNAKTETQKVEGFISRDDRDAMMRASYYILTKNFTKTINRFVVFQEGKQIVQIPHGIGQRSLYIDILIRYFEEIEEYEKCAKLAKLRAEVIEFGD